MNKTKLSFFILTVILFSQSIFATQNNITPQNIPVSVVLQKIDNTTLNTNIDLTNKFGICVGYEYLSVKYGFSPDITFELRGSFAISDKIYAVSGREYTNLYKNSFLLGYIGLEGGWTTFNTYGISGSGAYGMLFVGSEYFITKHFSIGADIGPQYIVVGTHRNNADFLSG